MRDEKKTTQKFCWKNHDQKSRESLLRNIDVKTFRGAYGVKSCRCKCSCGDGY